MHTTAKIATIAASLTVLIGWGGCSSWQQRYRTEHVRLRHAEKHIRKAEREIQRLQRLVQSQRKQMVARQRVVKQLEGQRASYEQGMKQCHRRLGKVPAPVIAVKGKPTAQVEVRSVRFWEVRHRRKAKAMITTLRTLVPRWQRCYQRYGRGLRGEVPLRGAFWLVYGAKGQVVVKPQVWFSSLRKVQSRGSAYLVKRQNQRAALLEKCIKHPVSRLRHRKSKRMVRIAALLRVADTKAQARKLKAPGFKWPWKRITRRWSGPRQICAARRVRYGSYNALRPNPDRPCKRGLKCCYPCGIRGCASICLRRCPRGLP